ncbi:L-threonylcarbamoyladenylate synthase [Thiomicrorhabdus chilensis]|uniref:L-threonylcarbamoyladenylate synthase n=1 Tax=Thiomicrorhabdus chilensis TaxID=63656 RepID=UPI00040D60F3|nr:L-threonylcarbamoyladenylate synthase [Thiomicrorhabdus chilensis]
MKNSSVTQAVKLLKSGGVVAYPTEAVYGLGCDPFNQQAVELLFHVKQRPPEKGVILVAASVEQVLPYVQLSGMPWEEQVLATWPGPVTWVLPLKQSLPDWITGGRDSVAIRVSAHLLVQQLCQEFGGPIVSTSANLSTQPPAKSCDQVSEVFGEELYCLQGELGSLAQPTQIRDAQSGEVLR